MTSLLKRLQPPQMTFWDRDDVEECTFLLYMWVMEVLPTDQFGKHVRQYHERCPGSADTLPWNKEVRQVLSTARFTLLTNFDVVRLKLATFRAVALRLHRQDELEDLFAGEGLPRDCADLVAYFQRDDHFWKVFVEKYKRFSDPLLFQDMVTDPKLLVRQCSEDFTKYKIDRKITREVRRKLTFIVDSHNESRDWLEQEVRLNAVSYYYKVRPFRSRLHAVNYGKSSVDGKVQQIIKYYTTEDHARLREETGSMLSRGNRVVVSMAEVERSPGFENPFGTSLSWADMAMGG